MDPQVLNTLFLSLIFLAAFLYSSVGHGGASGYLAAMALFHIAQDVMRPSALIMNAVVSLISFLLFHRRFPIRWGLVSSLVVGSIPAAFLGASLSLHSSVYNVILGAILILSSIRLFIRPVNVEEIHVAPPLGVAISLGVAIGLIAGLLGIGGGVVLSPVLIFLRWATVRESAVIASLFIFVNSISGMIAVSIQGFSPDPALWLWTTIALSGAIAGSIIGSFIYANVTIQRVLGLVIVLAGFKLIL